MLNFHLIHSHDGVIKMGWLMKQLTLLVFPSHYYSYILCCSNLSVWHTHTHTTVSHSSLSPGPPEKLAAMMECNSLSGAASIQPGTQTGCKLQPANSAQSSHYTYLSPWPLLQHESESVQANAPRSVSKKKKKYANTETHTHIHTYSLSA